MKPSEVIAQIVEILKEEGDLPLFFTDPDGNYYYAQDVRFDEDDYEIVVRMAVAQ